MNDALNLNNEAHQQNLAYLNRVRAHILHNERIAAIDLLMQFRWHERMRLRARLAVGCANVPSPHESRQRELLAGLKTAIQQEVSA